jgi:hypothetical protein
MLSQIVFIALISYIIVQRVRVTRLSKQNMAKVLAEGGKLHSSNYVGFVKIFQYQTGLRNNFRADAITGQNSYLHDMS